MSSFDASHADPDLPDLDDRLAIPGERYEVIDGEWVYVAPADPPHATHHIKLGALIELHVAAGFTGALDMLTRTSKVDDFAPDASIFPSAPHPQTGRRQLEHLAFEIVSTETLRHAGKKAAKLIGRGVRRVFAIDVERHRALEWSSQLGTWSVLPSDGVIDDLVFAVPLPIDAMIRTTAVRPAIVHALIAQRDPVIEAARADSEREGVARGRAISIVALLDHRGVAMTADQRSRILAERDAERLQRWLAVATVCREAGELFTA